MRDGIAEPQADGDGGRAALKELGLDKLPAQVVPIGAVLMVIQLLWASHGEVDVAAGKAREAAARGNEPERYNLIAALLDRAAAMPSITGGALRR